MGMTLVNLLPAIVGSAILPLWITMTILLLRGEGGVTKAAAFAAGGMTVRLVQGFLFGYAFGVPVAGDEGTSHVVASTLLLVVGVLMLASAAKLRLTDADPDAPPPRWMTALGKVSARKAFGMAALLTLLGIKPWVFTLSAIAVIEDAKLSPAASVLAYLFFVVAAHSLVLTPIVSRVVAPARLDKLLEMAFTWLERNNRAITLTASLVFGLWFVGKGAVGLLPGDATATP